jgi:F0F1-type ATP synthase epsilon subunit
VTVLAPVAEAAEEIDVERARRAEEAATAALSRGDEEDPRLALLRAQTRLKTAAELGLIIG